MTTSNNITNELNKYDKKTPREHVLLRPDTYIGSTEIVSETSWVYEEDENRIIKKEITNHNPIKEKSYSFLTESQSKNNVIKFQVDDVDNSLKNNSINISNTNSNVNLKSNSTKKKLEEENISHNHLKYLINQLQQLENHLTQAHEEIKRFNEMSNAYSTIAIPDLTRGFTENEIIDYINNNNKYYYNNSIQKLNNYVNNNQLLNSLQLNDQPQKNSMMSNKVLL